MREIKAAKGIVKDVNRLTGQKGIEIAIDETTPGMLRGYSSLIKFQFPGTGRR